MTMPVDAPLSGTSPVAERRAQMGRYALWQCRDYVMDRGLPTMIVAGLFGFLGAMPLRQLMKLDPATIPQRMILKYGSAAAAQHAMIDQASMGFIRSFIGSIVFLGALFAMNGLVSNDRKQGWYRFLFAKPVTPERYYGQAFILHGIGFLIAITLLALLWGALILPVLSSELLACAGLVYLCYAGIAFLLTAAARWDWLSLVAVTLASTLLWEKFGESTSPFAKLLYLLPPITKIDSIYAAMTQRQPLPWQTLWWLAGYGLVCFIAGLAVLRHRRLATP